MGEGAAHCASESEARVERNTAELWGSSRWRSGLDLLLDLFQLRAGLLHRRAHLADGFVVWISWRWSWLARFGVRGMERSDEVDGNEWRGTRRRWW